MDSNIVSVIIPIFNVERYLDECVHSVCTQTYHDLEIILVDDGSPDDCPKKCDEYAKQDSRIKVIHRTNGGLSTARNSGIDVATGKYLYFLDADDKLFPDAIKSLVSLAIKYPGVDMVQGNIVMQDGHNIWRMEELRLPEYLSDIKDIRDNILNLRIPQNAWNKLFSHKYINDFNMKFQEGLLHEDVKWTWDNQRHISSMAICLDDCYWYRCDNEHSILHRSDKTQSVLSYFKIVQQIASQIENKAELKYAVHFINVYRKIELFELCANKELVLREIASTKAYIKRMNNSFLKPLIYECVFWSLPIQITSNRCFIKLYYEYSKHKGFV